MAVDDDDDAEVTDESDDIKDAAEETLKNTPSLKPSFVVGFLLFLVVGRAFSLVGLEESAPVRLSIRLRIICRMIWKRLDCGVVDVMIMDCLVSVACWSVLYSLIATGLWCCAMVFGCCSL